MTDRSRTQDGQVSAAGAPELGHPWLSWSWSSALRGLTYALPAGLLVPLDVGNGLAVAVGVIPAAVMPLAPRRAQRFSVVVLGALMGLSILVGSALATVGWLAVVGLFALSVAAALAAASRRDGVLALTLCLPLVAIGFSYDGLRTLVSPSLTSSDYSCPNFNACANHSPERTEVLLSALRVVLMQRFWPESDQACNGPRGS